MANKIEETLKARELEIKLEKLDKHLSKEYSIGRKLAQIKIQEKLNQETSNLFFS